MKNSGISAAILAGGAATRLGGITKSKVLIDGRSVISRIMDTISCIFGEIIIVTNNPAEFSSFGNTKIVADIYRDIGPLGGIHAGLMASSSELVFIVAGDMPNLNREIIHDQIETYSKKRPDVLIPRIGDYLEPLHSIYKRSILPGLEKYIRDSNDNAVWKFINTTEVEYFSPSDESEAMNSFMSINSPSDAGIIEKIIRNRI